MGIILFNSIFKIENSIQFFLQCRRVNSAFASSILFQSKSSVSYFSISQRERERERQRDTERERERKRKRERGRDTERER